MKARWIPAASALALLCLAQPAQACRVYHEFDPAYVKNADVVLVASVADYEVLRGKNMFGEPIQLHARFRLKIDEVIRGKKPTLTTVNWYNSTFELPETLAEGPYVIALRKDDFQPKSKEMMVLQQGCSLPFILAPGSDEAKMVERLAVGGTGFDRPPTPSF